jgi:outer membrane receptor for ferrienterochelin and colicins
MGRLNLLPNHLWGLLVIGLLCTSLTPTFAQDSKDIADLSLDSLLDNIVVAASKHEETLEESPANVFIVSQAMIDNYGCQTIGEALALVPGIYVTDDYSLAQIGVRGISTFGDWNSHVMLLIDGRSTSEQYGGTSNLEESGLSLDNIERIEVIKGPASSLYGSNVIYGLIDLTSRMRGKQLQRSIAENLRSS